MTCGFCKEPCNNEWCSTMKEKELSPCPICKGRSIIHTLPSGKFVIQCTDCKISSPQSTDKQYLIFCWNNVPL